MRVGHEQAGHKIFFLGGHAGTALAAAALRTIGRERYALDIACMTDGDDHILAGNQVFVVHFRAAKTDFGAARRCELVANGNHLFLDDIHHAQARAENIQIIADFLTDLVQLIGHFIAAERGEALQTQIENGASLFFGEVIGIVFVQRMARIVDKTDQRSHIDGGPAALHQLLTGRRRVGRTANEGDHLVNIGNGNSKTDQHMRAITRLVEQELGTARHHFLAEGDEGAQHVEQRELFRLAAIQRHHVAAKRGLQRRIAIKLVQHDIGHGIALQLHHDAIAFTVRFIAQIGNAINALVAHQFGHLLDHRGLVHLIGNLGDDNGLTVATHRLDCGAPAHDDRAAPGRIGGIDAVAAQNDTARREIGTGNQFHQFRQFDGRIVDQRNATINDFAQIVRRNIGGHADRNTA
ncbi:Uncharacterised protein [Brucella suis]|nr:Uncharacterised protein [Brucella suis]